jgi:rhodanese-related sulfurtransferase
MYKNTYSDISLAQMNELRQKPDCVLVDVRENWEFEEFNEGGINIPLAEIRQQRNLLSDFSYIIVLCSNGVRSKVAALDFCRVAEWNDKKIFHLHGGILEAE